MSDSLTLNDVLIGIVQRFPRPYDPNEAALLDFLRQGDEAVFNQGWQQLCTDSLSTVALFGFLFPDFLAANKSLEGMLNQIADPELSCPDYVAAVRQARADWIASQSDLTTSDSLFGGLLNDLLNGSDQRSFRLLSRYYVFRDLLVAYLIRPDLLPWLNRTLDILHCQKKAWTLSYCDGYAYQGYARLGICGVKPTEERLARYEVGRWLDDKAEVFDIGANNAFLSLELARQTGFVHAIEFNPFLVEIGRNAQTLLGQKNCLIEPGDFLTFRPQKKYDAVFSLANHCTIDGKLSTQFEDFIAKIWAMLRDDGILFFESHNVFGSGSGQAGDDGDLDAKFDVVERYFKVEAHRMVERFTPRDDIDKLFIVLRKRPYNRQAVRQFSLAYAKQHYQFVSPAA